MRFGSAPRGYLGEERSSWREWKNRSEWENISVFKAEHRDQGKESAVQGDRGQRSGQVGWMLNMRQGEESGMSPEFLDQAEWTCYLQTW